MQSESKSEARSGWRNLTCSKGSSADGEQGGESREPKRKRATTVTDIDVGTASENAQGPAEKSEGKGKGKGPRRRRKKAQEKDSSYQLKSKDDNLKSLLLCLLKLSLNSAQTSRMLVGAVCDHVLLKTDEEPAIALTAETQSFVAKVAELRNTEGAKPLGPPHVFLAAVLIEQLSSLDVGGSNRATLTTWLKTIADAGDEAPQIISDEVRVCKLHSTRLPNITRLILCVNTGGLRTAILGSFRQLKFEIKAGQAPPSALEDEAQDWLAVVAA